MTSNRKDLKTWVRYDGKGRVIAGSAILRKSKPFGKYKELFTPSTYQCCNQTTTSTTTVPSFLPQAQDFFAVNTSITDEKKPFINAFFQTLVDIGWDKFYSLYLPIWGNAGNNKWNLIIPEDSDSAYRLSFFDVEQGTNYIKSNGTSSYVRTHLNGSVLDQDNVGQTIFVKNAVHGGSNRAIAGVGSAGLANCFGIFLEIASVTYCYAYDTGGGAEFNTLAFPYPPPQDRFITMSRTSSTMLRSMVNSGTPQENTSARVGSMPSQEIYFLCVNNNGTPDRFMFSGASGENEVQLYSVHKGLTIQESQDLETAWLTLKSQLSV